MTGNHEYWSLRVDEMLNTLRKYGVEILDGKTKTIEIKGQSMSLSGIDDPDAAYYSDAGEVLHTQLNEIQTERDRSLFSVLLAHRPSYTSFIENTSLIWCSRDMHTADSGGYPIF